MRARLTCQCIGYERRSVHQAGRTRAQSELKRSHNGTSRASSEYCERSSSASRYDLPQMEMMRSQLAAIVAGRDTDYTAFASVFACSTDALAHRGADTLRVHAVDHDLEHAAYARWKTRMRDADQRRAVRIVGRC